MTNAATIGPYQITSRDDYLSSDDDLFIRDCGEKAQWSQINSHLKACDSDLAVKIKEALAGRRPLLISDLRDASQKLQCRIPPKLECVNAARAHVIEYVREKGLELRSINYKFKEALGKFVDAGLHLSPPDHAITHRVSLENVLLSLPLTPEERSVIDFILNIDPKILSIKTPKISGSVPFLSSRNVTFAQVDAKHEVPLLPAQKEAFERMASACEKATGEKLYPVEGYRSKGYQLTKFIEHLVEKDNFDILTTSNIVAFPGYSEHESTTSPAMDINVADYTGDFVKTKSYKWMQQHAHEFGFSQSYTEGNTGALGVRPEPWHWKFIAS